MANLFSFSEDKALPWCAGSEWEIRNRKTATFTLSPAYRGEGLNELDEKAWITRN